MGVFRDGVGEDLHGPIIEHTLELTGPFALWGGISCYRRLICKHYLDFIISRMPPKFSGRTYKEYCLDFTIARKWREWNLVNNTFISI